MTKFNHVNLSEMVSDLNRKQWCTNEYVGHAETRHRITRLTKQEKAKTGKCQNRKMLKQELGKTVKLAPSNKGR